MLIIGRSVQLPVANSACKEKAFCAVRERVEASAHQGADGEGAALGGAAIKDRKVTHGANDAHERVTGYGASAHGRPPYRAFQKSASRCVH